jgi:hypothetical protein
MAYRSKAKKLSKEMAGQDGWLLYSLTGKTPNSALLPTSHGRKLQESAS